VVWASRESGPDPELVGALTRRPDFHQEMAYSGYEAFAALCLHAREARQTRGHAVLVLVDPARIPAASRVVHAAAMYAPGAAAWAYDRAHRERLRAVSADELERVAEPAWPTRPSATPAGDGAASKAGTHPEPKPMRDVGREPVVHVARAASGRPAQATMSGRDHHAGSAGDVGEMSAAGERTGPTRVAMTPTLRLAVDADTDAHEADARPSAGAGPAAAAHTPGPGPAASAAVLATVSGAGMTLGKDEGHGSAVGAGAGTGAGAGAGAAQGPMPHLLTDEELAMLLAADLDDAGPGPLGSHPKK
jgi:hypothetical protein